MSGLRMKVDDDTEAMLRVVAATLADAGARVVDTGRSDRLLAAFPIGPDAGTEGHFFLERHDRGWVVSTPYERPTGMRAELTGDLTANTLAAATTELFDEARRRYIAWFHPEITLHPTPPPWVRSQSLGTWAERLTAIALHGELATTGTHGYDLTDRAGQRVQVKASVRNPKSGLISTLQFKTRPSYWGHDLLVHVEMTPTRFPVRAWLVESDILRSLVPDDGKTHQVEALLTTYGSDVTGLVRDAFDQLVLCR